MSKEQPGGRLPGLRAWIFFCLCATLAWLGMLLVHEAGHIVVAGSTGGQVVRVVLHPLAISRTDVVPNPAPLWVAWGGPVGGALVPLAVWWVARCKSCRCTGATQFFAGYCLLANGLYLALGSFDAVGDAGDLLHLGVPHWGLLLFGFVSASAGLWLWHRLGPLPGVRGTPEPTWSIVLRLAGLLAAVAGSEALLSPWD